MLGCGSESYSADRYIDLLTETRVDCHGLFLYDLDTIGKSFFRMAGGDSALSIDGLQLTGTSHSTNTQSSLLECGSTSARFAVQDVTYRNNGSYPKAPTLCSNSIPAGSTFRLFYGDYNGVYRYNGTELEAILDFEIPDGSVTAAKTSFIISAEGHYEEEPLFTNAVYSSIAPPSGQTFNQYNMIKGYRYGAGTVGAQPSMASSSINLSSGFIEAKVGDVIRIKGAYIYSSSNDYVGFTDSDKNFLGGTNGINFLKNLTSWGATNDSEALEFSFTIPSKDTASRDLSTMKYFYFSARPNEDKEIIVTINEEIAYRQKWIGTPMQFGNEVKQDMANVFLKAPNGDLYTLKVDNSGNLSVTAFDG